MNKKNEQIVQKSNFNNKYDLKSIPKEKFKFANKNKDLHDKAFETKPVSFFHDSWNRFAKNKSSIVAGIIILIISLFAIIEPIVDPKAHVDAIQYPSGFQDTNFALARPYNSIFANTGWWDGKQEATIGEDDYNLLRFTDSNHQRVELIEEVVESYTIVGLEFNTTKYKVDKDTHAVGCKYVTLSKDEYENLVQYEKDNDIYQKDNSIMKPIVDVSSYLSEVETELAEKGVASTSIDTIIDRMTNYYNSYPDIYYKLFPKETNGQYSDTKFSAVLENGEPVPIYSKDTEGNLVYSKFKSSEYTVRVDYFDYFTYANGFEPYYLFGANQSGQDIYLRLALGARFSLLLGISVSIVNFLIGLFWGAISGYYGGNVDLIMERITDIIGNIPTIIIMTIAQIQFTNNTSLENALGSAGVLILAILLAFVYNGWIGVASTTRMQFYRFKGQEYVLASRTLGAPDRRLIFKHILPNAAGTLVTSSVLMIPGVIFSESSLSYLGIIDFSSSGICSIGVLLNEGQSASLAQNPHVLLFPAAVISLLMISFNLFGNGLRDAFNTSLKGSE